MWLSCDADAEVMCSENKDQLSSFKSLLLACQVCNIRMYNACGWLQGIIPHGINFC